MTIELTGLEGTNPLGFFASLGLLDVVTRQRDPAAPMPRLWWTDEIDPQARLEGVGAIDELVDLVIRDREQWFGSPVLEPRIGGALQDDVKLSTLRGVPDDSGDDRSDLRIWIEQVYRDGGEADRALLHALVAEGASMETSPAAKPSHFHFTAGQQKFLQMIRELRDGITADDVSEALIGPWRYASRLPVMGWDTSRGERVYALRGHNPSGDKKQGVPAADWLAVLGLRFFPVATRSVRGRAQLVTTGCSRSWKHGTFTWPLWGAGSDPTRRGLSAPTVQSLVADPSLVGMRQRQLEMLGVIRVLHAPITRSDQGGYGSFGPASDLLSTDDRLDAMVL